MANTNPTFHILHTERGGGYTDIAVYPTSGDTMVIAGIRQMFAPRVTNKSAIDIYVRGVGQPFPATPTYTRYTKHKADSIALKKYGRELQIFCGTHTTDQPLDPNGARDFFLEKDEIANVFPAE